MRYLNHYRLLARIRCPCEPLPATDPAPKEAPDVDPESEIATPLGVPQARRKSAA